MTEHIDIGLKRAAVLLADASDYSEAANTLNLSTQDLTRRIEELEDKLCIRLFQPKQGSPQLTYEGRFLIPAFREALAHHENCKENRDK